MIGPPPGRAVLACRCGRMLDFADMHRSPQRFGHTQRAGNVIEPILCSHCAYRTARTTRPTEEKGMP